MTEETKPDLRDLASQAYRLHFVVDALDMVNNTAPCSYPPDASEYERKALNALTPMIEVLSDLSGALAKALDRAAEAEARQTRKQ